MSWKNTVSVLTAVLCVTAMGCAKKATEPSSTLDQIKAKGSFVLGLDDAFPPMGFRAEGSQDIVGFDIDLAKEVAKRMGVEVELRPVEWDGILMSLKKGDIDVIWNGLTITEQRQKEINFTDPYLANDQIIVVQKDSPINSKADLAGKTVGLQMGSTSENALNKDPEVVKSLKDVRKFENNTLALMDLSAGRVDAVVVDEIVGRYYIAKKPGTYRVLEENFGSESYGVGVRKEDTAFLAELNKQLNALKTDGAGKAISEKWFGEDILVAPASN